MHQKSQQSGKPATVRYSAAYPTGRERIEDFSPNLFWDADPADLDFSRHMKYVVQRVLELGTLDDMRHMFSMYGFDNVVATSKTLRSLDPVSFSFIVNLSGQPQEALELELASRGIPYKSQPEIVVSYKGAQLRQNYRADIICFDRIILELKAAKQLLPEHSAQLYNYLRATDMKLGLLINFSHYPGVEIKRIAR